MADTVIDNPSRSRFELPVGGVLAVAEYRIEHGRVVLAHTEVPSELSGQGVGSRLAKGVLDAIRASGRRVILECDFMAAYVARHPEYADLLAS
ncbi:GNAT family N-acetyltransferase [Enterovirga sp.]|uniref:GNAT family N-acetyltransferase n=1 Tax=Enterovirga sp. TaxID=2026350 RepID=UPI002B5C0901|nr:GNAT family N-acetyltransferase [Enterovirga sp.]HMO28358.1 GNAT family N-acetyltransferase [Enterovirga sp.]